jgi:hypothetical protein
MPDYFPEIDRPLWSDTEVRSLQKIVGRLEDSISGDLFGRTKISQPETLFDSSHIYQDDGSFANSTNGAGASVSYLVNQSSVTLNVGTVSGEYVYRESKKVFTYQPGKSLQVLQTFVFNPPKANLRQRAGYFSSQNGFYIEQEGTDIYLVKRSYISGMVVNTRVPQDQWNRDPLNGSGPSSATLDLSKSQILFSEYEWLGVGSVVVGFVLNGNPIVVHQFDNANVNTSVYITSATLPVRYEIENTDTTASSSTMKQICVSVLSNGGYEKKSAQGIARRTTAVAATVAGTIYPLVTIRLASDRLNAVVIPSQYHLQPTSSGSYEYFLIRNGTLTGASFDTTTFSNVDYDVTATAINSGTIIEHGYFDASAQSAAPAMITADYNFAYQLGRNSFTSTSDTLTLAFATFTSTGAPSAIGAMGFYDLT